MGDQKAYGIFEAEAFKDKAIAERLRAYVIGSKVEEHPEASGAEDDQKIWHIYYVQIPQEEFRSVTALMMQGMYEGWYSLLWDAERIRVIFNNGVREIDNKSSDSAPSFDPGDVAKVMDIAKSHGLDEKYMGHYLRDGLREFSRHLPKKACISGVLRALVGGCSLSLDRRGSTYDHLSSM